MERPLTQHINFNRTSLNLKDYVSVGGYQAVHNFPAQWDPKLGIHVT